MRGMLCGPRLWLWCRGRRSTAPRRRTPSLMTTVRCRPLPLRPGISSSKREVVCCAQAGRTTAHEPSMLAALLLNLGVVYARAGQPNNDIINTHSPCRDRCPSAHSSLPAVRSAQRPAAGTAGRSLGNSGMCRQKGALALVIGHQRDSTACRASRSYIRSAMKGEASAVSRRTASTACA